MEMRAYLALGSCLLMQAVQEDPAHGIGGATVAVTHEAMSIPRYHREQSKEILGSSRTAAATETFEKQVALAKFVYTRTKAWLPKKYKAQSRVVATALIETANHHQMDPLLLMALIRQESTFNPLAKGRHGEIGLMQVKPATAAWLMRRGLLKGDHTQSADQIAEALKNPEMNIRAGTAFLATLRTSFKKRGPLYLSAYNMGATNVRNQLREGEQPKIYSSRVISHYVSLALDFSAESLLDSNQMNASRNPQSRESGIAVASSNQLIGKLDL